jgi:hypothetical protein
MFLLADFLNRKRPLSHTFFNYARIIYKKRYVNQQVSDLLYCSDFLGNRGKMDQKSVQILNRFMQKKIKNYIRNPMSCLNK